MRRLAITIINWEWLILILILPLLLFPLGWGQLLLLIIPLFWLIRKVVTGRFLPDTPFDTTLLILLTSLLISLAAVFNMEYSFPKIAGLIFGIALFYAAVQHNRNIDGGQYNILAFIILAGSGLSLAGILAISGSSEISIIKTLVERFLPTPIFSTIDVMEIEVNPNEIAGILGWIIPLLAAVFFGFWRTMVRSGRWWFRLLHLIMIILLLLDVLILLDSRSRGGYVSVFAAILVMLAIRFRWGRWLILLTLVGAIALGFYFDLGGLVFISGQDVADFGLQGRLEIWSRAFYGLADFPITGMGMNGFRQVVHILYPLMTISPAFDIGHAHNHLLQAGLDLGFLGLIAYLSIWIVTLALIWNGLKKVNRHSDRILLIGLSGSLTAGWIFGVFDAVALGARPGFLWWLVIALVMASYDNIRCFYP